MSDKEFEKILAAYGADRSKWPAERPAGMDEWILSGKAPKSLIDEAHEMDAFIASERAQLNAPSHLIARVMQDAEEQLQKPSFWSSIGFVFNRLSVSGMAVAALIGLAAGWLSPDVMAIGPTDDISLNETVFDWEVDGESS